MKTERAELTVLDSVRPTSPTDTNQLFSGESSLGEASVGFTWESLQTLSESHHVLAAR